MNSTADYTVISHKEYLGDLYSNHVPGVWTSTTFPINPGLAQTFPWSSSIANMFTTYKLLGAALVFKPTTGFATAAASPTLGKVIMVVNYNALAQPYVNESEMANSMWCSVARADKPQIMPIETSGALLPMKQLYIRNSAVPAGQDRRFFDIGFVQVASVGCPAADENLGELWLTTKLQFYQPIFPGPGYDNEYAHYFFTGVTTGSPLGSGGGTMITDTLPLTVGGTTGNPTLTFPIMAQGTYIFTFYYNGAAAAAYTNTAPVLAPLTNGSGTVVNQLWSLFCNTTTPNQYSVIIAPQPAAVVVSSAVLQICVELLVPSTTPAQQAVLTMQALTYAPAGNAVVDMFVTQLPMGLK
jgi:hypothetical protein